MKLWLDDNRPPWKYGHVGWRWAKTYEEAIALLQTGQVEEASLDHDLSEAATMGRPALGEKTGYDVVLWMEANNVWPPNGTHVHSLNEEGRKRMMEFLRRCHQPGLLLPARMS